MRLLTPSLAAVFLAACATSPPPQPPPLPSTPAAQANQAQAGTTQANIATQASAACQAANLRLAEPMPVSLIPESILRRAQSGWVTVRYDVVAGKARNAVVVASEPAGLYDAYALSHATAYSEPTGATVSGCIMHTNIKF
jgi:outer membrane biosynthesis protein TonB